MKGKQTKSEDKQLDIFPFCFKNGLFISIYNCDSLIRRDHFRFKSVSFAPVDLCLLLLSSSFFCLSSPSSSSSLSFSSCHGHHTLPVWILFLQMTFKVLQSHSKVDSGLLSFFLFFSYLQLCTIRGCRCFSTLYQSSSTSSPPQLTTFIRFDCFK